MDLALRFIVPAAGEDARAMSLGLRDAEAVLSDTSIDGASIRVTVGVKCNRRCNRLCDFPVSSGSVVMTFATSGWWQ